MVAGLIISSSGGGSGTNQNASTSTPSATASERIFTHIAAECSLIKPATLASIAPGATCTEAPTDAASASMKQPSWSNENIETASDLISIQVTVNLSPDATGWFSMSKTSFLDVRGKNDTLHDSRTLTGLGDQEYVGYVTDKITPSSGMAGGGRALGQRPSSPTEYNYDTEVSGQTETQQQAENAARSWRPATSSAG